MEIVAENASHSEHFAVITLLISFSLISLSFLVLMVKEAIQHGLDSAGWSLLTIVLLVFGVCISGLVVVSPEGPDVTYTAIVEDYNAVYSQGYEIVSREGDGLYTIKEAD